MYMVFEEPPFRAVRDRYGMWQSREYVWTRIDTLNDADVFDGGRPRKYIYVDRVTLHEFGHTLGLPDFPDDTTGLANLHDAVMNMRFVIQDADIDQLKAIYLLHSAH